MKTLNHDEIRRAMRENYGSIATASGGGCVARSSCCGPVGSAVERSVGMGYSKDDVTTVPDGANLGLGCGNPQAIAGLTPGETVLDLGSGAGFDCLLAARAVGENGRVIGVDMTPEMIGKARENTIKAGFGNVEFRLGEIEHLPVADACVDVIISNCVINLSPEKPLVFEEAFRVLRRGGRLAVSDVVATADLPDVARENLKLYTGCVAGAETMGRLETMLEASGFTDVRIEPLQASREIVGEWAPGKCIEDYVVSAGVTALKP